MDAGGRVDEGDGVKHGPRVEQKFRHAAAQFVDVRHDVIEGDDFAKVRRHEPFLGIGRGVPTIIETVEIDAVENAPPGLEFLIVKRRVVEHRVAAVPRAVVRPLRQRK